MESESITDLQVLESRNDHENNRLGSCEVCASQVAKYTCPRCEIKTCSLKCNKIHKQEIECSGDRDRTKYIPLNKFTNLDLSSDYRLLEEVSRSVETTRKKFGKRMKCELPFHLIRLKNGAAARNTVLKFLPFAFQKHQNNSTYFDARNNLIMWHVEWIFVNGDNLELSDAQVPETKKINSILNKYLQPQEDPYLQEKLQFYQSVGNNGLRVLLKAEGKKGRKFYDVDTTLNLKECLSSKKIIEYPTMYVMLQNSVDQFEIIDSDNEDVTETNKELKKGAEIVNNIIRQADNKESVNNSLSNLLFVSEHSEEEISD